MDDTDKYASLPIPTYEEAISSRPSSSQNSRGPGEVSDDAERQGLLEGGRGGAYRPPTVESPRSSEDSDLRLPEVTGDGDEARRQIEELDYLDPNDNDTSSRQRGFYHRTRLRSNFSKRLANISATFSSLRLPSFRSLYAPVSSGEPQNDDETPAEPQTWRSRLWNRVTIPDQYRMSLPIFARLFGLFLMAGMIYILFALDIFPGNAPMGRHFNPEAVRQFVQNNVRVESIEGYLQHISSFDHVAGTEGDYYLATWMREQWLELGGMDSVDLLQYFVYMNYPTKDGRSVKILSPEKAKWTAKMEEETVDEAKKQTLAWHGHSQSGQAEGHLIYANGGSREDFGWLQENGVKTKGAIALIRQYATQEDAAMKIRAAEEAGCAGVLLYSDRLADGEGKGDRKVWPDGPWRPQDSVQRDDVSLNGWVLGDPLTPGWPSRKGAKRLGRQGNPGLVQIPSLPLAWRDAQPLIEALMGHGEKVPNEWTGGNGAGRWFSGADGKDAIVVQLRNHQDENTQQRIWNLHGVIEGIESPAKKLVVANHRDAWCFGAADPGSGTAVMMEVVSIFTQLRKQGWRPLRTIEFASWDAGEFNMMGSTEYVEDNIDFLRDNGVAYINVDAGVYGPDFHASASPLLKRALMHVLERVSDPYSNSSLKQIWDQEKSNLDGLAAGSDFAAFQHMAGTSSLDFGFKGAKHGYPSQSCYDTFDWVQRYGDPDFLYHHVLAQIWALLILEIADRPLIPFDLQGYAQAMELYVKQLQQDAEQTYARLNTDPQGGALNPKKLEKLANFTTASLTAAIEDLKDNLRAFHRFEDHWTTNVLGAGGLETTRFALQRLDYNERLAHFETDLLDLPKGKKDKEQHGLPGREQFKHVLFGPQAWASGEVAHFPAVRDALEGGDWADARVKVERAAEIIRRAGERLVA